MRTRDDLRPGQLQLIEEVKSFPDGIMVLGMGGGKTVSWLTAVQDMVEEGELKRGLVLAPARVVENVWPNEPAKWEHLWLDVQPVVGTPARRKKIMATSDAEVLVVSIDNVRWLVTYLQENGWDLSQIALAIDEISKMKDPYSKRGRSLRKIARDFNGVWGMTGTPRPNSLVDLFQPIRLVGGLDVWGERNFEMWRAKNFYPLDYNGYRWEVHEFTKPQIERVAKAFMVHATVDNLGLPQLNTGEDFHKWAYMTKEQEGHNERLQEEMYTTVQRLVAEGMEQTEAEVTVLSQGVLSMKMTQLIQGFLYAEEGEPVRLKENPKLDILRDMHDNLGGDRAVVCYGFREEIEMYKEVFSDMRVAVLGGETTPAQANAAIKAWNECEIDRLLLHPASAGHGVELQFGGHHMIWAHPTWSPELYAQTIKRIHRPGQEFECFDWQIRMDHQIDHVKWERVQSLLEEQREFMSGLDGPGS